MAQQRPIQLDDEGNPIYTELSETGEAIAQQLPANITIKSPSGRESIISSAYKGLQDPSHQPERRMFSGVDTALENFRQSLVNKIGMSNWIPESIRPGLATTLAQPIEMAKTVSGFFEEPESVLFPSAVKSIPGAISRGATRKIPTGAIPEPTNFAPPEVDILGEAPITPQLSTPGKQSIAQAGDVMDRYRAGLGESVDDYMDRLEPAMGHTRGTYREAVSGQSGLMFNPPGQKGMTGEIQAASQAASSMPKLLLDAPTPQKIQELTAQGYVFDGLNDAGRFRFRFEGAKKPILESEVGVARPTPKRAAAAGSEKAPTTGRGGGQPPQSPLDEFGSEGGLPPEGGPTGPTTGDQVISAINFPRAVMASVDFSAPLRQGLPLISRKAFWTSLDDMFKAWGSEDAYNLINQEIMERPLFRKRMLAEKEIPSFAEEAGLKFTGLDNVSMQEEAFASTLANKIPLVRRSNRAYTAFLNKLRADTFESLVKESSVFTNTQANLPLARELASFVNIASGRGSLGKLEPSAKVLNTLLFSPRLMAARLSMLNPKRFIFASPAVQKETLRSLFAMAAVGNTLVQMGKLAGGTVETDPASSDFGKLKIGNTRLDPYGGFQQYIVAAQRLLRPSFAAAGEATDTGIVPVDLLKGAAAAGGWRMKSSTSGNEYDLLNPSGGRFDPTMIDIMGRFARGKLHPVLGFATSLLMGMKEMTGESMKFTPFNPMGGPDENLFDNAIAQRFIPILLQDMAELARDGELPTPIKMMIGGMATFGMGQQTYGEQ